MAADLSFDIDGGQSGVPYTLVLLRRIRRSCILDDFRFDPQRPMRITLTEPHSINLFMIRFTVGVGTPVTLLISLCPIFVSRNKFTIR